LKVTRSSIVRESDLAMTGTTLTTSESFLSTAMSIGFSLKIMKLIRKKKFNYFIKESNIKDTYA